MTLGVMTCTRSKLVNLKHKPTLTNSYNEPFVLAKKRARRYWQSSRAPSIKLRLTEASNKLRKTLHKEADLIATKYIKNLLNKLFSMKIH